MINFREIFNPNYSFIGLLFIALIITIILFINKNIKYSIHLIGKTLLISGIITLILSLLLKTGFDLIFPSQYKFFAEIITNNLFKNYLYFSIFTMVIGILCLVFLKAFKEKNTNEI